MNIQELEGLLKIYNQKANSVKTQLTDLLVTVSDGRIPSTETMSSFDDNIAVLRTQYTDIYEAAQAIAGVENIPATGENIGKYVDIARDSRFRIIREQIDRAKNILTRFITVKAKLEMYSAALKPFQDTASELLALVNEENISDILPQTAVHNVFLNAVAIKNIGTSAEGLSLMREISNHYPWEVQMGLAANQYYFGDGNNTDTAEIIEESSDNSADEEMTTYALTENVESSTCGNSTEKGTNANKSDGSLLSDGLFDMQSDPTDSPETSMETSDLVVSDLSELCSSGSDIPKSTDGDETVLTAVNKLKSGTPSASSFRKDIVELAKVYKSIRAIMPLMTNLGVLTKEQCFFFAVCMDCIEKNDQNHSLFYRAINALAAKGFLACFEYYSNGEKMEAYCLSGYSNSCIRKESISVQMRDYWDVSFGNYRFCSENTVESSLVCNAIAANEQLLQYIYSMKKQLDVKEFSAIKSSITWKDGYYQVAAFHNGTKYICHLISPTESIEDVDSENIIICGKSVQASAACRAKARVFMFKDDSVTCLADGESEARLTNDMLVDEADVAAVTAVTEPEHTIVAEKTPTSTVTTEIAPTPDNGESSASTEEVSTPVAEDTEDTTDAISNALADATEDASMDETEDYLEESPATTPEELLKKKGTPTDDEFCTVVFSVINSETDTLEQLKSTIVNAVLLAKGAGLEANCPKAKILSDQLCLATNIMNPEGRYSSEIITNAFPNIDSEDSALALATYMHALITPSVPFDYGLNSQTSMLFDNYEDYFEHFEVFKPLFNKLLSVRSISANGFTPAAIASLGDAAESESFLANLKRQASQYLTVQTPKTRMKALPILYSDCFDSGSSLYECMSIIADGKLDRENLEIVQMVLSDYCDIQDDMYSLNESKIEDKLNAKWNEKNNFKLAYDAYNQALKQFKIRLELMLTWSEHISKTSTDFKELPRMRKLKSEMIVIIQKVLADTEWQHYKNSNVLRWTLYYIQKYLNGELSKIYIYSDFLFTGIFGVDDEGALDVDESMAGIRFYEPWRNALKHILTPIRLADNVRDEILGDMLDEENDEAGLKDNLHQLQMLGRYLQSDDEEYLLQNEQLKEATDSADDRTTRFMETLELAYTYNQINETEKETISGIMTLYKGLFYKSGDFACWRRFLEALELQIQEFASGRKKGLRAKLDIRLAQNATSPLLIEANRLLEEDKNFAVTEEYITRFDSGETELEDELDVILHDKDYFDEFLAPELFNELLQKCRQGKGRALKNFGWDYVERKLPSDWTSRLRDDSKAMITSWPSRKDTATSTQVQTLFRCLGFNVTSAVRKKEYKEEIFQISVKPTAKSMADYRHPIAAFGTQIKNTINVIMLYGNHTERQLVDTVSSLDLGGISIVLIDQPIDAAGRRLIGQIFHTQTSGQNPFLLIDQVLFLFLAMHQETERMPALLKCTLPYTTYQPFVRDGGSTTDEMFCGRSQELATIIDPNGACVVYGGRQLGKTALLERAESRCSKPDSKEYAVYSTIIKIDNEFEVVETLISDIDRKTNGKIVLSKCTTLKAMCSQLSKLFRNGQIATMHLFIDEVDCFLGAIADEAYRPIQPLVDLKRETKNSFKFVLTGLHNVCRAKNATKENGIFGQLGTPLCIKPLSPTDALKLLSRPLNYLGFQIDRYPHLETILTNTNYYPGILQFFGYMLVETLTGQYAKYYSAVDGNPPFTLRDEQLGAVMNSSDLNKSIKDKFRWSLELDSRYFMIARCITMLYHLYEEDRSSGTWMGFKVNEIREISESYDIHCLENESVDSFVNLLDEMVEMGILSQPTPGCYRLRRSSFVDIIGENLDTLEMDIVNNNEVVA